MAKNFSITEEKKGNRVTIKLDGDFDGTSAHELCIALKKAVDKKGVSSIQINYNTAEPTLIPFAISTLAKNLTGIFTIAKRKKKQIRLDKCLKEGLDTLY